MLAETGGLMLAFSRVSRLDVENNVDDITFMLGENASYRVAFSRVVTIRH